MASHAVENVSKPRSATNGSLSSSMQISLEYGQPRYGYTKPSEAVLTIHGEDHTLGNVVRYMCVKDTRTKLCGYSIPHPSDELLKLRLEVNDSGMRGKREDLMDVDADADADDAENESDRNDSGPVRVVNDSLDNIVAACDFIKSKYEEELALKSRSS